MRIISILRYDPSTFMKEDGIFATVRISDGRIEKTVSLIKRKHLAYFDLNGIKHIVHNTGHLLAPRFEVLDAA
jgi:hypothetical protein